jgi:hypothetical protein
MTTSILLARRPSGPFSYAALTRRPRYMSPNPPSFSPTMINVSRVTTSGTEVSPRKPDAT